MNGRSFDEEAGLPLDWYFSSNYLQRNQFDTLVSQILAVKSLRPRKILEIGPGNGFVSGFFRAAGHQVTTFDINPNLKPDVVGNIVELDQYFQENAFDLILCAEVLEHLPFEYFDRILSKFRLLTNTHVVITLPRRHHILVDLRMHLKLPFVKPINLNIFHRIPDRRKWEGHHWEIDYDPAFSLRKITEVMKKHFVVTRTYPDDRVRYHQFFILKKVPQAAV